MSQRRAAGTFVLAPPPVAAFHARFAIQQLRLRFTLAFLATLLLLPSCNSCRPTFRGLCRASSPTVGPALDISDSRQLAWWRTVCSQELGHPSS
ncbi:uncharacterized protein BKA78DRAFT_86636 [Phyllosticta capitalensis]|uniref:uncharacterized protein n=1 Tax=Phyllosticta capitalensis TaxID=121624 RepID=UPI00312F2042